ncbi:MAG: alternative ribosome rescue aminoacyl-tRNA hydrolase ArfB [Bacteroidota bacterium]
MDSFLVITGQVRVPLSELTFRSSRSGGPGGQNVNKLETRVELLFDVLHSPSLTDQQRELVMAALQSRIDDNGILRIVSQESRSQWQNKQLAIEKFTRLLQKALKPRKKRIATKPSRKAREKRLRSKRVHGEKKKLRKIPLE